MNALKEIEPNVLRRKRVAIDVLREIEAEEGHDVEKIKKRMKKEEILKTVKKIKKKKKAREEKEGKKEMIEEEIRAQASC